MPIHVQRFFLFLALSVPFCLILGPAPADIAVILVGLGFLGHSALSRNFTWTRTKWIKIAIFTWIYLIICGALASYEVKTGIFRGLEWVRFPLFAAALGYWLLPLDPGYKWLRRSLITILVLTAIDTLVQLATGTSLTGNVAGAYAGRLTGPFGDRMIVGIYTSRLAWPAIGLAFMIFAARPALWQRLALPCALIGLLGATILVSGERSAFALFGLGGLVFWLGAKNLRLPLFVLGTGAAVLAALLVTSNPRLHERFVTSMSYKLGHFDQSSYGVIFSNAITAWKISPLIGVGPKNFHPACMAEQEQGGFKVASPWEKGFNCARHTHNYYLEWLAETGLIGLGLFLTLVVAWSRQAIRTLRTAPTPYYYAALGFVAALATLLWPVIGTMSFFINWSGILFWWVLGLSVSNPQHKH